MAFSAIIMVLYPENGYLLVVLILDISFLIYAIKSLIYYFTMARFMVGGQACLYKGVIALDFGIFIFNLDNMPTRIVLLYLVGCLALSGGIDVFRAMAARKLQTKNWQYECFCGVVKLLFAISSLFFHNSLRTLSFIFAIGLIHSAITNIVSAFSLQEDGCGVYKLNKAEQTEDLSPLLSRFWIQKCHCAAFTLHSGIS